MDQLFVMELLVNEIVFPTLPIPQKKQIIVQAKCGSFANLEIRTDVMGTLETQERSEKRVDLDIGCGKSLLFAINPATLHKTLKECPLEISVLTKLQTEPMGTTSIPWSAEFLEMVESTQDSFGYVTPVELRDQIPLQKNKIPAGSIDIYLRLTFLGRNIDTHIQITESKAADGRPGGPTKQFLFKSNNNATTFQCQKYGLGSDTDVIPVAPIYRAAVMNLAPTQKQTGNFNQSVISIMGKYASMSSFRSVVPSVFRDAMSKNMVNPNYGLVSSRPSDMQSIRERIPDKLFMNFQDMDKGMDFLSDTLSEIDMDNLTVAQIERLLCSHPDCPAAKLFKNYGIGPLAKGNGLGALNCEIEAPISYGLSHLNGRIDNYGPLGTYSRPKSPSQSFTPKVTVSKSNSVTNKCSKCSPKNGEPLRLKGGGPICGNNDNFPDPKNACQDLMDEFNRLLTNYKNALGPCGQATCPFAHNLVADTCKKLCNPEPDSCPNPLPCATTPAAAVVDNEPKLKDDELAACALSTCPYKRDIINPADKDHKKNQLKSACGSPKCPFIREKYCIDDDPEFPPMPCAGKACPFKVPKDLPPIHWDCPEPLPKGECKNPNCPLVNKEKIVCKYFPQPKSPCGSPTCPFAVMPCTFPGCPFAEDTPLDPCPPICPYTEPVPTELNCTSSICPFVESKSTNPCDNKDCPYAVSICNNTSTTQKITPDTCDNESCPYSKIGDKKDSIGVDYSKNKNLSGEPCTNTTCTGFGGKLICQECGDTIDVSDKNLIKQKEIVAKEADQGDINEKKKKYSIVSSGKSKMKKKYDKSEEMLTTEKTKKKKRRRRRRCGYVYDEGTYYPGTKVGHRYCVSPKFNVPPDMGWLWNVHTKCLSLRPRRGWKPGAIGKTIAAMINEHRRKLGMHPISEKASKRRKGLGGTYGAESSEEDVPLKPTLLVKKKDGVVYVTMNPLKDPKTLEDNENPYMDCSPMQFKIVKNKQKDFKMCYCGEENEEEIDVSSSSSSELDIEFTPPAGIIRPERLRKKKNICHTDTQYNITDCGIPKKEDTDKKGKGKGKAKGKKGKGKK